MYIYLCVFFSLFVFTEIARVRGNLFHLSGVKQEPLELPEACGPVVTLSEKVYVPVKEHPDVSPFCYTKNINQVCIYIQTYYD